MNDPIAYPWAPLGDSIVFETPEQTQVEVRLAPFGTRLVAAALDAALLSVASLALLVGGAIVASSAGMLTRSESTALTLFAGFYAVHSFLGLLYYVWSEVSSEGQTWGKRRTGIRTVMATGQALTVGPALVRNCARLVEWIPLLWLIPTLSRGCQRIGDLLAGTYVVVAEAPSDERPGVDWPAPSYAELGEKLVYLGGDLAQRLYPDDLNLIEYLFARLAETPPSRRPRLLRAVAERYVTRLGLEAEREKIQEDPRRFLHELGLFVKGRFEGRAF
jgi:uncharacterized RDD family membrane protein YckC